jgi:cell division protein FtsL
MVLDDMKNTQLSFSANLIEARVFFASCLVVLMLIFASGVAVIITTHDTRQQLYALQELEQQRNALQIEWSRLLLEESSLTANGNVAEIAQSLNLQPANPETVVVLYAK